MVNSGLDMRCLDWAFLLLAPQFKFIVFFPLIDIGRLEIAFQAFINLPIEVVYD